MNVTAVEEANKFENLLFVQTPICFTFFFKTVNNN